MQNSANVLYSKYKHGSLPVDLANGAYNVTRSDGSQVTFTSKRSLISSFYDGRDNHIPFDRYFKLGRYAPPARSQPVLTIPEMFGAFTSVRITGITPPLGIDLSERGREVAKLFYAGFGQRVYREGFDPDDVLQEVYKGILSRNGGKCPFDPRKASFSHYVYMVTHCVISNYRRQVEKCQGREIVVGLKEELVREPDGKEDCHAPVSALMDLQGWLLRNRHGDVPEIDLAIRMLPHLYAGQYLKDIAALLEVPLTHINKAMAYLRTYARTWFDN